MVQNRSNLYFDIICNHTKKTRNICQYKLNIFSFGQQLISSPEIFYVPYKEHKIINKPEMAEKLDKKRIQSWHDWKYATKKNISYQTTNFKVNVYYDLFIFKRLFKVCNRITKSFSHVRTKNQVSQISQVIYVQGTWICTCIPRFYSHVPVFPGNSGHGQRFVSTEGVLIVNVCCLSLLCNSWHVLYTDTVLQVHSSLGHINL